VGGWKNLRDRVCRKQRNRWLPWLELDRRHASASKGRVAEANGLRAEILLWGSLLSIFFAVLGWFVAGVITGPLNHIADAATRLSEGADIDIPLVKGSLEVEKLSMVIRHLVENLT
jgi:HAMP domain-containing protein